MESEHTDPDIDDGQIAKDLVVDAAGSVAGSLLGLAVGGPAGAVTGAAAGPAATALARLTYRSLIRRRQRAEEVLTQAAALHPGGLPGIEESLLSDPSKLDVAVEVLEAASRAGLPEKKNALAAFLASLSHAGLDTLDRYLVMAHALSDMEKPHLQLLALLQSNQEKDWTPDDLAEQLGEATEMLRPIVRLLELHGLITDVGWQTPPNDNQPPAVIWRITPLGSALVASLKS